MVKKNCQFILVGHHPKKLILSIDKTIVSKVIFVTEKDKLPGTKAATKALEELINYYKDRKVEVENVRFNLNPNTIMAIAELTHKILQQKLLGYKNILVNISGGLRYIDIWLYITCSITDTDIIHGNFIYEHNVEVGITDNIYLPKLPLDNITRKQFDFLELFFNTYGEPNEFFRDDKSFDENLLLSNTIKYTSIEKLTKVFNTKKNKDIGRGTINGYIQQLKKKSLLNLNVNPDNKKEKSIEISYLGIAYFLNELYKMHFK